MPTFSHPSKHSFNIHLKDAIFRGLGSTNINEFKSLGNSDFARSVFGTGENSYVFQSNHTPFDYIKHLAPDVQYKYHKYDTSSMTYTEVLISETDLLSLITYHEKNKEDGSTSPPQSRKTIREIQNSLEGCVVGMYTPTTQQQNGQDEEQQETQVEKKKVASIQFLKAKNSGVRKVVGNGIPTFADYPRTPAGTRYSYTTTNQVQQSGLQGENVGVYRPITSSDDPKDKVVAPLRVSFDQSTGTWNIANQILVIAADDIPSAEVRRFEEVDALIDGSLKPEDFSTGTVAQKPHKAIGNKSTGRGITISPERGNPNLFTPKFIECSGDRPVEMIRITNRTNNNIIKGSLVLCNYVNGEWYPIYIEAPSAKKAKVGKWNFSQFIVNYDYFFRDARFANTALGIANYGSKLSPATYKAKTRLAYYAHDSKVWRSVHHDTNNASIIVKANFYPENSIDQLGSLKDYTSSDWDISISGYWQCSNFDFVSKKLGGNCVGTILGRTNVTHGQEIYRTVSEALENRGRPIEPVGYDFPHFWGAILTEGYSPDTTSKLFNPISYTRSINNSFLPLDGTLDIFNDDILAREWAIATINNNGIKTSGPGSGLFADRSDFLFKQLPADIATNAGFISENGTPIKLANLEGDLISINIPEKIVPSPIYLTNNGLSLYDLKPISPNIIQFTPLSYHTLCLDKKFFGTKYQNSQPYAQYLENPFSTSYRKGAGIDPWMISKNLRSVSSLNTKDNPVWWIFDAARDLIKDDYPENTDYTWTSRYYNKYNKSLQFPIRKHNTVKRTPSLQWDGYWLSHGRGCGYIGIIGASCSVNLAGTKEFTISVLQNLGVRPRATSPPIGSTFNGGIGLGSQGSTLPSFTSTGGGALTFTNLWGNNDAQESLGGAVLYMQAYESWPEEDKWFDARFNTVFHFNPKPSGQVSIVNGLYLPRQEIIYQNVEPPLVINENSDLANGIVSDYTNGILSKNFRRTVDKISTSVEHRVPSKYDHATKSHKALDMGTLISSGTKLAPPSEWRVETNRDGKLLPFVYQKAVIGLYPVSYQIIDPGAFFKVNDILSGPKSTKIKVKEINNTGGILNFEFIEKGEGFLPGDFPYTLNIGNAKIKFTHGVVYGKISKDSGPKLAYNTSIISTPSKEGENYGRLEKDVSIKLLDGVQGNQFDLFFWFQNDPTFVSMFYEETMQNQYINLKIN